VTGTLVPRIRGRQRLRWATIVLLVVAASTVAATVADANSGGAWIVANNGCGGTCNLRGSRADITMPNTFQEVSNQGAAIMVGGDSGFGASGESGGMQLNSFSSDCDSTDTNGHIHSFSEVIAENGPGDCMVMSGIIDSETHTYQTRRRSSSLCSKNYCVGTHVDGTLTQTVPFNHTYMDAIYAQGELARNSGTWYNGNTVVSGDYPGSGTVNWQRTSDIDDGTTANWITIQSAACGGLPNGNDGHWYVGNISGGFNIHFVTSGGHCNS
jgi:hypothetical protein